MTPRTGPPGAGGSARLRARLLWGWGNDAMVGSMSSRVRRLFALLSLLSLPVALVVLSGGAASARVATATSPVKATSTVTSSSLGTSSPTFTGPAATGCARAGCSLLTGPFPSPSTAGLSGSSPAAEVAAKNAAIAKKLAAGVTDGPHAMPSPVFKRNGADPTPPTVSCQPLGPGCDPISRSAGGAKGVKGLNAVDSGTLSTNILVPPDIEPADQGLCAEQQVCCRDQQHRRDPGLQLGPAAQVGTHPAGHPDGTHR